MINRCVHSPGGEIRFHAECGLMTSSRYFASAIFATARRSSIDRLQGERENSPLDFNYLWRFE